jgi:hypothetical protein
VGDAVGAVVVGAGVVGRKVGDTVGALVGTSVGAFVDSGFVIKTFKFISSWDEPESSSNSVVSNKPRLFKKSSAISLHALLLTVSTSPPLKTII